MSISFVKATVDDFIEIQKKQQTAQSLVDYALASNKNFDVLELRGNLIFSGIASFDLSRHQLSLTYVDDQNELTTQGIGYAYEQDGIRFTAPIVIHHSEISQFKLGGFDNDSDLIVTEAGAGNVGQFIPRYLPGFELVGATKKFLDVSSSILKERSKGVDSLLQDLTANNLAGILIYKDYQLSSSEIFDFVRIVKNNPSGDLLDYLFFITAFQQTGEDGLYFQWDSKYSSNVTTEVLNEAEDFLLFFFDNQGFTVFPQGNSYVLISRKNPRMVLSFEAF